MFLPYNTHKKNYYLLSQILYKVFYIHVFLSFVQQSSEVALLPLFQKGYRATKITQVIGGWAGILASLICPAYIKSCSPCWRFFMNRYFQEPCIFLDHVREFFLILSSGPYPQNLRADQQAWKSVYFPWFRHYFLKSTWWRLVFTPVLIFYLVISFSEVSFDFQLRMKKGKLAIVIRIKLKLIAQGISIYL